MLHVRDAFSHPEPLSLSVEEYSIVVYSLSAGRSLATLYESPMVSNALHDYQDPDVFSTK